MNFIWATRGHTWGFRFLLDGELSEPLPEYERAFSGLEGEPEVWRRVGNQVALRFPDPLGRKDIAGRVIPHDFVVFGPLSDRIDSVEAGLREIWPLVASEFADVWDTNKPPVRHS